MFSCDFCHAELPCLVLFGSAVSRCYRSAPVPAALSTVALFAGDPVDLQALYEDSLLRALATATVRVASVDTDRLQARCRPPPLSAETKTRPPNFGSWQDAEETKVVISAEKSTAALGLAGACPPWH